MPHTRLTLAHSPDPDDVFMWWPITGMIDPRDHDRVVSPPELDTRGLEFRAIPEDIAVLNRRAIDRGDLDITALSMFTYAHVQDRYILTSCGSSVGVDYGPKLVMPTGSISGAHDLNSASTARELLERALLEHPGARIAVPGIKTTAFACLALLMGWRCETDWREHVLEMPFDRIMPAVAGNRERAAGISAGTGGTAPNVIAGVLIHQSQLTYAEAGLVQVLDFGKWWHAATGAALPLGGNALRRDLEERLGPGSLRRLSALLLESIRYALAHRERSIRYAMGFAPEIDFDQADRYIRMYVNDYTLSLDPTSSEAMSGSDRGDARLGRQGGGSDGILRVLIERAAERGLCPSLSQACSHIVWA